MSRKLWPVLMLALLISMWIEIALRVWTRADVSTLELEVYTLAREVRELRVALATAQADAAAASGKAGDALDYWRVDSPSIKARLAQLERQVEGMR